MLTTNCETLRETGSTPAASEPLGGMIYFARRCPAPLRRGDLEPNISVSVGDMVNIPLQKGEVAGH